MNTHRISPLALLQADSDSVYLTPAVLTTSKNTKQTGNIDAVKILGNVTHCNMTSQDYMHDKIILV